VQLYLLLAGIIMRSYAGFAGQDRCRWRPLRPTISCKNGDNQMTEIENQWKVVEDYIRSIVGEGPGAFKCVPVRGPELQAVYLRACAAGLKKCSVKFCRPGTDASYQPEELNWRMRPDTQSGQLVWNVDRLGRALHSEELAQAILEQLNEYCTDYERELQSFYD
jgi:hypothetical protein